MTKNTKTIVSVGVIALAAYGTYTLVKMRKPTTTSFVGDRRSFVGDRRMMSGSPMRNIVDNQTDVKRPSTFNANGTVPVGKGARFFKTESSGWLRASGK